VLVWSSGRKPPRRILPNPNGYDDFLRAAALIVHEGRDTATLDHKGLQAFVSTNSESLRLLRLGLTRHCVVPLDLANTNSSAMIDQLAAMKRLVQLLSTEGRLREMNLQPGDAAQSYVDAIRFGNEISRGGVIIHRQRGISCEAIGEFQLGKLVPRLSLDEARRVIADLQKIDDAGVTWEEAQRNEDIFASYQPIRGFNPLTWARNRSKYLAFRKKIEVTHRSVIARRRLLTTELAVRCYQLEQGQTPAVLERLVPNYLQRVRLDPFSGRSLVYVPQGTNWLLYSVGENFVDDGGKRAGRRTLDTPPKGDLFFDSP